MRLDEISTLKYPHFIGQARFNKLLHAVLKKIINYDNPSLKVEMDGVKISGYMSSHMKGEDDGYTYYVKFIVQEDLDDSDYFTSHDIWKKIKPLTRKLRSSINKQFRSMSKVEIVEFDMSPQSEYEYITMEIKVLPVK